MKHFLLQLYYRLLAHYARKYLHKWQPLIIGINGSVGKTSCRMIVDEVLQIHLTKQLKIYTSPKNFNGELGMSLSIFKIEEWLPHWRGMISVLQRIHHLLKSKEKPYDVLLLEYGIDRPKEMEFLLSIAQPHISILTKLDAVHSLQFGDSKAIAKEELKLQQATLLYCYINTSEGAGMKLSKHLKSQVRYYHTEAQKNYQEGEIFSSQYGLVKNLDTTLVSPVSSHSQLHFGTSEQLSISSNLLGFVNHSYLALGYDILQVVRNQYNLPSLELKKNLTLQLQPGRFSLLKGMDNSIILDSSYNSSPLSLRKVIDEGLMIQKELYPQHYRIFIIGEMRELGDSQEHHHRELADYLLSLVRPQDYLILLGQSPQITYDILSDQITHIDHFLHFRDTSKRAQQIIHENTQHGRFAFIIAKGSQNTIFSEEVVKSLLRDASDAQYLARQGSRRLSKKGIQLSDPTL